MAARSPGFHVELGRWRQAVHQLAAHTRKGGEKVFRSYAKSVVSNPRQGTGLLQITPPGSQGMFGLAARRQGERAIERDLSRIFTPVHLKNKREERWPLEFMRNIHEDSFRHKVPGRPIPRGNMTRHGSGPFYVDRRKFRQLARELNQRIGRLSAGWLPAARALGAAVPAWIARHGGGRGSVRLDFRGGLHECEMIAYANPGAPVSEVERRIPYAINYSAKGAERALEFLLQRASRSAGFRAR